MRNRAILLDIIDMATTPDNPNIIQRQMLHRSKRMILYIQNLK
jgi:hypothetical protein